MGAWLRGETESADSSEGHDEPSYYCPTALTHSARENQYRSETCGGSMQVLLYETQLPTNWGEVPQKNQMIAAIKTNKIKQMKQISVY